MIKLCNVKDIVNMKKSCYGPSMKISTREKTTPSCEAFYAKESYAYKRLIKRHYGYHDEVAFGLLIKMAYNLNYLEIMPYLLIFPMFMHL